MKCYNHTEVEAVATCLGCGKALCLDCCMESESAIICSNKCANKINQQSEAINLIRKKTLSQNKISGVFCFISGSIFVLFGLYHITRQNCFLPLSLFCITLGIGIFIGGGMYLKIAKKKE